MVQKAEFHTMSIPNRQYRELHDLEAVTGIRAGKHLKDAIDNYLHDVGTTLRWMASEEGKKAARAAISRK